MKLAHIKADTFFREYLPFIKNYKHKLRGKNGRGNSIKFTDEELNNIATALNKHHKELMDCIDNLRNK
jgi:hypothetical protein